jgi:hypothetical protein
MTQLTAKVSRVTRRPYAVLRAGHPQPVVVTLNGENDTIEFRIPGGRTSWFVPIPAAFRAAVVEGRFVAAGTVVGS